MSRMDHVKAAKAYVAGHKPGDVHPDVAAAMHRFETAQGDTAEAAHAKALVDMVELVGDDYAAPEPAEKPAPARRKPAKKSTARKAAGGRSRS